MLIHFKFHILIFSISWSIEWYEYPLRKFNLPLPVLMEVPRKDRLASAAVCYWISANRNGNVFHATRWEAGPRHVNVTYSHYKVMCSNVVRFIILTIDRYIFLFSMDRCDCFTSWTIRYHSHDGRLNIRYQLIIKLIEGSEQVGDLIMPAYHANKWRTRWCHLLSRTQLTNTPDCSFDQHVVRCMYLQMWVHHTYRVSSAATWKICLNKSSCCSRMAGECSNVFPRKRRAKPAGVEAPRRGSLPCRAKFRGLAEIY
jgi:hypothetical protein